MTNIAAGSAAPDALQAYASSNRTSLAGIYTFCLCCLCFTVCPWSSCKFVLAKAPNRFSVGTDYECTCYTSWDALTDFTIIGTGRQ